MYYRRTTRAFDTSVNYDMYPKEIKKQCHLRSSTCLLLIRMNRQRTIILSPSGVEIDSGLSGRYTKGTLVVLTAMPDKNSVFAGGKVTDAGGRGMRFNNEF